MPTHNEYNKIADSIKTFKTIGERNEFFAKHLGISTDGFRKLTSGYTPIKKHHILALEGLKQKLEGEK